MKTHSLTAAAAVLSFGLLAAACSPSQPAGSPGIPGTATPISSAPDPAPTTSTPTLEPRHVVDARSYYTNYVENRSDGNSASAAAPGAAAGGAMPDVNRAPAGEVAAPAVPAPIEPPVPTEPPGINDDNTFTDSGDSEWTDAKKTTTSTFGLDVDTGSFSVAQEFVSEGYLPPADSIRPEEWINSYSYGDAPPPTDPIGLTIESGPSPHGADGTSLVRIGVSTRELSAAQRPRANITFVIDTSGSMDIRERLGLVQSSLALLVNNLREDDTIAIVTYGSEATPLLEPTKVADADRIVAAIDRLKPGGSTNMEDGLRTGYRQARESLIEDGVNVVVLASDGVANVGSTDADELTEEITRASDDGISLVTVGYGMGNYNDTLMEQLSNQGNGFYSYIDTFEEAERLFVHDLTPTLTTVAYDAKIQVNFDPKLVERFRLIGYQNRLLDNEDFTDDSVDAGELGAGHQVSALYEVEPVAGTAAGAAFGSVSIRWADEPGGKAKQRDAALTLPVGPTQGADNGTASDSLRMAAVVAATAELLRTVHPPVGEGDRGVGDYPPPSPAPGETDGPTTAAPAHPTTSIAYELGQLHDEAAELAEREVAGAAEFAEFLSQAQRIAD